MADDAVRNRSTFDWDAVPLDLHRALAASAASRDEKAHVAAASPEQLIDAASRSFGQRGATSRDARAGALVLREQWLPTAAPEAVHAIYGQLSHPRTAATPADQQAFLATRKLNEGYRTLLWQYFRAEHRHARPAARARTSNVRRDPRRAEDGDVLPLEHQHDVLPPAHALCPRPLCAPTAWCGGGARLARTCPVCHRYALRLRIRVSLMRGRRCSSSRRSVAGRRDVGRAGPTS
jgi:hypothetical protein